MLGGRGQEGVGKVEATEWGGGFPEFSSPTPTLRPIPYSFPSASPPATMPTPPSCDLGGTWHFDGVGVCKFKAVPRGNSNGPGGKRFLGIWDFCCEEGKAPTHVPVSF